MVQFSYPTIVLSNSIDHLSSPICMVNNKIIILRICVCLGLGLCLSKPVLLCYLIQDCSSQIVTGVAAKPWLCSVPVFNMCSVFPSMFS